MIHIATVHYETDKWVDLQLGYIKRYIKQEYRIYAFLSGEAAKHKDKFYFACCEPVKSHAIKLNILADIICLVAQADDVIMFIDGDAFPIAPLDDFINTTLKEYPLAAIQRLENFGDCQPHPSFCITTPQLWKNIKGDWKEGYEWTLSDGTKRTDVGGNLYRLLLLNNIEWKRILRTQSIGTHEILFGVYGNIIYHHAAGFRRSITIYDLRKKYKYTTKLELINSKNKLTLFDWLKKIPLVIIYRINKKKSKKIISKQNEPESRRIYKNIINIGPSFFYDNLEAV